MERDVAATVVKGLESVVRVRTAEAVMLARETERRRGGELTEADRLAVVALLVEIGNVDTVYRDVYLERAGAVLQPTVSREAFQRLEQEQATLGALALELGRAVESENWPRVRDLSQRAAALKKAGEEAKRLLEIARSVYAPAGVQLDPFSPGLHRFTRLGAQDLDALRTRVGDQLTALEESDATWKDFYAARRAALASRVVARSEGASGATGAASTVDAREAAARALKAGDMERLAHLASELVADVTPKSPVAATAVTTGATGTPEPPMRDLLVSYSSETLARARELGLAPRRIESRVELTSLWPYAWSPVLEHSGHVDVRSLPLPAGSSEGLRDRVEMLIIHPLVNSGGARHLPRMVAEDMLVEDFPDPEEGANTPSSELLTALGLPGRRGLTRIAIEQALLAHGSRVVQSELGLDPRVFRLVCIPSDAHLRLGEREGWGRQPFWTHFDGYLVMPDGRLRALAGGDVRLGGLYELLGVGRDYESDRLLARFAVVQRERMVAS